MTIRTTKVESHWNYFLALERDLDVLSRYVEFHEDNFACYSLEIGRILLGAGAEVDVVCKLICRSQGIDSDNILTHREGVTAVFPDIPTFKVQLMKFGLVEMTPWDNWQLPDKAPDWWTAHNKVKHHRDEHYAKASLGHALNAVAGLFVVTLHLYRDKAKDGLLLPNPQLIRAADAESYSFNGETGSPCYELRIADVAGPESPKTV